MKLEEQFSDAIYKSTEKGITKQCIEIANQHAIDFVEWKEKNCYDPMNTGKFYIRDSQTHQELYSVPTLLEIYNKKKL